MRYLAGHPLYAQTIAAGAFAAGPRATERNREIVYGHRQLLIEGAPERARSGMAVEGVMGAIGHTIRCQVASGQIELLPCSPTTSPMSCSRRSSAPTRRPRS